MPNFVITEQVLVEGCVDLYVLLKSDKILAELNERHRPKMLFTERELSERGLRPLKGPLSIGKLGEDTLGLLSLDNTSELANLDSEFVSLRQLLPELSYTETQIAARASQLSTWLSLHRFCGRCGHKTQLASEDRALVCIRCDNRIYPSLAPCVIGVVMHGDKILLANGVRFRSDIYSALAGFIEPGESAEEAFAREVKEEVGIDIDNIEYVSSQSWPFPNQLMFAFLATYKGGDLQIDRSEINHADWYRGTELPLIPGPYTIARRVINEALHRIGTPQ